MQSQKTVGEINILNKTVLNNYSSITSAELRKLRYHVLALSQPQCCSGSGFYAKLTTRPKVIVQHVLVHVPPSATIIHEHKLFHPPRPPTCLLVSHRSTRKDSEKNYTSVQANLFTTMSCISKRGLSAQARLLPRRMTSQPRRWISFPTRIQITGGNGKKSYKNEEIYLKKKYKWATVTIM